MTLPPRHDPEQPESRIAQIPDSPNPG
jgi:hypothetical protein